MEAREIEARLLEAYGLRVDPQTSAYVARRLSQTGRGPREFAVIGQEAKTGTPRRLLVDPRALRPGRPAAP